MKQLAERGAYALLRLTFSGGSHSHGAWVRHAPLDLLSEPAPIDVHEWEHCDAWLGVAAPENTHDRADIAPERTSAVARAYSGAMSRLTGNEVPWVLCWYPTPALAQDAHMTLPAFEDFLYASCLIDWKAEHERISRYAMLFDQAEEVRIVADGTDLRLSIAGQASGRRRGHRQHAGRRGLRLPGRDVRRRERSRSPSSRRCGAAARCAASACASPKAGS